MKKNHYFLGIILSIIVCLGFGNMKAQAEVFHTVDEALAWVRSLEGQAYDYDGEYGAQCVDLIMGYYAYLGVKPSNGNGCDYATNILPAGWQRIKGAIPQPGDILVYSGTSDNKYGHVAIYESGTTIWHGRFIGQGRVQKSTTYAYNELSNYWGVVRPDWGSSVVSSFPLVDGASYKITSVSSGKVLDVPGASMGPIQLQQWDYVGAYNQMWKAVKREDGYCFVALHSGLAMDVDGGTTSAGGRIAQSNYHGEANQRFKLVHRGDGKYSIHPVCSGLALDVDGNSTENAALIYQCAYHGGANQLFVFEPVGNVALQGITLSSKELVIKVDETKQLTVTGYTPADATVDRTALWTSSDNSIVKIDNQGNVTGVKAGTAAIICNVAGVLEICQVTVTNKEISTVFSLTHVSDLSATNATIHADLNNIYYVTTAGFYFGEDPNNMTKYTENANCNTNNIYYGADKWIGTLKSNTDYYWKIYAVVNGVEYITDLQWFKTPAVISDFPLVDGAIYKITNVSSGKVLDVPGAFMGHRQLHQWDYVGAYNQMWKAVKCEDGYCFVALHSGLVMDVEGGTTSAGGSITQSDYHGAANQRFKLVHRGDGKYSIHPVCSDLALDVYGNSTENAALIYQYAYHGGGNQLFTFEAVDTTVPTITNEQIINVTRDGYTVTCQIADNSGGVGVGKVCFPTWTEVNGQDDIDSDWSNNSVGYTPDGVTYYFDVKVSDHNFESGKYNTHIYAYDKSGNYNVIELCATIIRDIPLQGISLNSSNMTLRVNETQQLSVVAYMPTDTTVDRTVSWNSSNVSVAKVDSNGIVTAVGTGTATITATVAGKSANCVITVNTIASPTSTATPTPMPTAAPTTAPTVAPTAEPVQDGWQEEGGVNFWYEKGVRQGLEGRGKEIYDAASNAWYWLDSALDGAVAKSKDVYQESLAGAWGDVPGEDGQNYGKWVRYDEKGHMVKGWNEKDGGTYYFDKIFGTMAKGYATIDGKEYYFDEGTGQLVKEIGEVPEKGWKTIDSAEFWYEGFVRQGFHVSDSYRGKEIYDEATDAWYWLDNVLQGAKAVSKDVYQESLAGESGDILGEDGLRYGKWVRYDADGHMIKGWSTNENGTYYFDPVYGTMQKGLITIDGNQYHFDEATGVLKNEL